MRIGNISSILQQNKFNKINNNKNQQKQASDVTFQGAKEAATAAGLLASALAAANSVQTPVYADAIQNDQDKIDVAAAKAEAIKAANVDGKIQTADIALKTMPVSEFYLPSSADVVKLEPNDTLPRNDKGTIIVTITDEASDDETEGNTLKEIVNKVYADALSAYDDEDERDAVYNKMIDEVVQANPELADYIHDELGDDAKSYRKIALLDLSAGTTSKDSTLDTRLLTIPTVVVYQSQGVDSNDVSYVHSSKNYIPSSSSASVIKDTNELLDGEYSSISDLIYGEYGEDISDEAYRDILYSVVNSPENATEFERVISDMNFNDIIATDNIHDLNRTLEENTSDMMIGLSLPDVTSFRVAAEGIDTSVSDKSAIIYQISPAEIADGQNDRVIKIKDNTNQNGSLNVGNVFALQDVLQFYSSPDGNGRFASVEDGKLQLNDDVNYVNQFAREIMQQVVYANLDIFSAEYEDSDGVHEYGVFDVADNYDTTGKSLEEIIEHSSINYDRMKNYSFVNSDGTSKFEDGVELHLPQFNYRLNNGEIVQQVKPTMGPMPAPTQEPDAPTPTPTQPTVPTEPTSTPTPTPTEPTEPTLTPTPTPTEPTEPTLTPTPTPTEPTEPTEPTLTPTPTPTEPTTPTTPTEPTTPTTPTEPTTPTTPTEPTTPTTPTEPTCPTVPTETPTPEPEPTLPTDPTEPTTPTEPTEPTTPTTPTEPTLPTKPSATDIPPVEPTDPTEPTTPTCPTTPTETPTPEPEPTLPTEPTVTPTPTEPTTPTLTPTPEPTDPTLPTRPSATDIPPVDPTLTPTPTEPTQPTVTPTPTEPTTPTTPTEPTVTPTPTEPTTPTTPTEPTVTPTPTTDPTCTTSPTDTPEPEPEPTFGPTPEPTEPTTPTEPTVTPAPTTDPTCTDVSPTDSPEPEPEPTFGPTTTPTPEPTVTPEPTTPTSEPDVPTTTPTPEPTLEPTVTPTPTTDPTCTDVSPTDGPEPEPEPTFGPTTTPTQEPTVTPEPTTPTSEPDVPTTTPTPEPTVTPEPTSSTGCGEEGDKDDLVDENEPSLSIAKDNAKAEAEAKAQAEAEAKAQAEAEAKAQAEAEAKAQAEAEAKAQAEAEAKAQAEAEARAQAEAEARAQAEAEAAAAAQAQAEAEAAARAQAEAEAAAAAQAQAEAEAAAAQAQAEAEAAADTAQNEEEPTVSGTTNKKKSVASRLTSFIINKVASRKSKSNPFKYDV